MKKFKLSKNTLAFLKAVSILCTIDDCNATSTLHNVPIEDFKSIKAWCSLNDLEFEIEESIRDGKRYTDLDKDYQTTMHINNPSGAYNVATLFSQYYNI